MTADLDAPVDMSTEVGGSSFELFYEHNRRPLVALAYAVSGSRLAAEDLA